MAKAKSSTKARKKPAEARAAKAAAPRKAPARRPAAKSAVSRIKKKTAELAHNPQIAEVVAATLVAAAAAIRDPKKARALADSAADEIGNAGKQVAAKSGDFWQLALDVARRSMEAVAGDGPPKKAKKTAVPKKKSKKKKK
jgi:hypothetical protein